MKEIFIKPLTAIGLVVALGATGCGGSQSRNETKTTALAEYLDAMIKPKTTIFEEYTRKEKTPSGSVTETRTLDCTKDNTLQVTTTSEEYLTDFTVTNDPQDKEPNFTIRRDKDIINSPQCENGSVVTPTPGDELSGK